MPGFARAINTILGAMRGEDEHEFNMAQTVLSDPVMTQKVLRLANSSMYSAFGQHVNTVSKAILVLGTDAIGHLALGLKLIEELSSSTSDSAAAHAEMEKAMLAGMVAQQVAVCAAARDPEEAVVCSMLHTLGRMMLTFYLPDTWLRLQQHGGAGAEHAAAPAVLGLSLEQIGHAAAVHWGLPANLIDGMRRIEPVDDGAACSHAEWLAALSTMSADCAASLWHDDADGAVRVAELAARFAPMIGVAPASILQAIEQAKLAAVAELTIAPLSKPTERRERVLASTRKRAEGNRILISGVAEMGECVAAASPGQMMSMALETVFQGLTFSRAVAFLRNRRDGNYSAKMSFGDGVRELLPAMVFSDAYEPNVFHAALNSDRVIFIENARDPKFAAKLPAWWKASLSQARSFVILPLCTAGQPAGFIYGDWDDSFPAIALAPSEFTLLNEVRALVVRSVERRKQVELVGIAGR
ncbi:MAG: HDOD domain-containing protein, partial [Pseudomonadota bacterium]|nr:HDOD domain-containing protein [Pseudomonadota bacterium]